MELNLVLLTRPPKLGCCRSGMSYRLVTAWVVLLVLLTVL
jgi:hypothetical protein